MGKQKSISSVTLALLLFITVFGMSNIPNNYAVLGNEAIGWFIILIIYFVPIALMMAELSSYNINSNSGMSGWITLGMGEFYGFLGAWAYFIANVFYIPMIASRVPVFLSWVFNANFNSLDEVVSTNGAVDGVITASSNQTLYLTLAFITVVIAIIVGIYFEKIFNKLGTIVGWLSLAVTSLFIILALLSVPLFTHKVANPLTIDSIVPSFSIDQVSTFAWILFAITGIETVGSYVARIKNPVRIVPKGITMAALLTSFAYIIGFVAMACIFSPSQISTDSLESLIAVVYAKAGTAWGFGPLYLRIIMLIYVLITVTAVILWLVSSVGVLFDTLPKGVISEKYSELKVNGIPLIGILFTGVMILLFLIISNSESSSNIYYTLYDMTTMAVLIPYLLVGISYIMFRKKGLKAKFQVTKNNNFAYIIGGFVVFITLVAIVFSAWDLTTPMSDRITWFILSAGGATFFILIGIALYLRTKSIHKSYFMLTCLFLVASFMFSKVILIFVVLILILWLINSRLEKNKI